MIEHLIGTPNQTNVEKHSNCYGTLPNGNIWWFGCFKHCGQCHDNERAFFMNIVDYHISVITRHFLHTRTCPRRSCLGSPNRSFRRLVYLCFAPWILNRIYGIKTLCTCFVYFNRPAALVIKRRDPSQTPGTGTTTPSLSELLFTLNARFSRGWLIFVFQIINKKSIKSLILKTAFRWCLIYLPINATVFSNCLSLNALIIAILSSVTFLNTP